MGSHLQDIGSLVIEKHLECSEQRVEAGHTEHPSLAGLKDRR